MNPLVMRLFGLDLARQNLFRALVWHSYRRVGCLGFAQLVIFMHAALGLYARPLPGDASDYLQRLVMPAMGSLLIMVWFYSSFRAPEVSRVFRTLPVTQAEINRIGWAHVLFYFPLIWLPVLALLAIVFTWMPRAGGGSLVLNLAYCVLFFGIVFGYRWIGFAIAAFSIVFLVPQDLGQLNVLHATAIFAAVGAIIWAIRRNLPEQSELMNNKSAGEPRQRWRSVAEIPKAYPSLLYLNSRGLVRAFGLSIVFSPIYVGFVGYAMWESLRSYVDRFATLEDHAIQIALALFLTIAIGTNSHRERLSVYRSLPVGIHQLAASFWLPCSAMACIVCALAWVVIQLAGDLAPSNVGGADLVLLAGFASILSLDNVLPTRDEWVLARLMIVPISVIYALFFWIGGWIEVVVGIASIYAAHRALVVALMSSSVMYREVVPEEGAKHNVAQFFGNELN